MVKFFRDVLSGPLYVVIVIVSIILIMAIIGYLMDKKQKADIENGKVVHVGKKVKVEKPINQDNSVNEIPSGEGIQETTVNKENK